MSDIEEAKKLIEAERQRRAEQCQKELAEILEKYDCELISVLQTSVGNLNVPVMLRAKD